MSKITPMNTRCSTCVYRLSVYQNAEWCCGYCYYTGHRRNSNPCNCNKYEKRTIKKVKEIRKRSNF